MNLEKLSIKEVHEKLIAGEISAVELCKFHLERAEKFNKTHNAFTTITNEFAVKQAEEADKRIKSGKNITILTGIPFSVKDVFSTKGIRTTAGSKALDNYIPVYTATVIQKLFDAGAVMIGKTNCDPFAFGASNENSGYGPVRNPWDRKRVPGGSSGGSAAVVAARVGYYSIGSDTGGSIRQPAAFCGVSGLKVTYGRNSRYGLFAMGSSLDTPGVLAKSMEDTAIVESIMSGNDEKDSTSSQRSTPDYFKELSKKVDFSKIKIGLPKEYFIEGLDKNIEKATIETAEFFRSLGAEIRKVSLPYTKYALAVYYIIVPSEISSNMARYDSLRFGMEKGEGYAERLLESRMEFFEPEVKRRIMLGTYTLSAGYYDAYYKKAMKVRTLVRKDFEKVFSEVDVVLTPVSPTLPFEIGEKADDPLAMYLADVFTVTANIAGIPGVSFPAAHIKDEEGKKHLPVGVQILGPQFSEELILKLAHSYQGKTDWHEKMPELDL
ncbi:Asp-tRNA(Asn)/Glu-tRNA(Gln) amidotransferase subunit GatA [Candidatus Dojkabacteria bacterium]|nr:Asp-tRNA(Asn)/Glu-tRNA(Gln) amidotransferase subunit GatA [Candidatus Dojkabacteria bacterium]